MKKYSKILEKIIKKIDISPVENYIIRAISPLFERITFLFPVMCLYKKIFLKKQDFDVSINRKVASPTFFSFLIFSKTCYSYFFKFCKEKMEEKTNEKVFVRLETLVIPKKNTEVFWRLNTSYSLFNYFTFKKYKLYPFLLPFLIFLDLKKERVEHAN